MDSKQQKGIRMNNFGSWLRNMGAKLASGFRHFMQGRYGTDKLNTTILLAGFSACFLQILLPGAVLKLVMMVFSYACMGWAIFRSLSRNTYKRYQENRKYLRCLERIKDKEHRYFDCPRCRQSVRVPRGKGKISITCPKCKEKFIKKT